MAWRGSLYRPAPQERPSPYAAQARARIHQPNVGHQQKEDAMARTARKPPEDGGEIQHKDFAGAVRLYRNDIRPAQSKVGEYAQEQSTAFKAIKKSCGIQPSAAKAVFKLAETEEAKRDDWIRCFVGLCNELKIPLQSNDLVDQAEGNAPPPARKPKLVTVPPVSDGIDADLVDAAEPAPGTSAAAIAAMRADHAKDKAEEDFDGPPQRNEPTQD
jgi:hypothetical protein